MGLYNFQERFVPFIQDGTKTHTIRAIRKYPQKVGALMHLFYGLRTKSAKRIISAQPCKKVNTIIITRDYKIYLIEGVMNARECELFGRTKNKSKAFCYNILNTNEKDELSWRDGFRIDDKGTRIGCFDLMFRWWKQTHELPFAGHIQYWK